MFSCRLAGLRFTLSHPAPELEPFAIESPDPGTAQPAAPAFFDSNPSNPRFEDPVSPPSWARLPLVSRTQGWVGDCERQVEVRRAGEDYLLLVAGSPPVFISSQGDLLGYQQEDQPLSPLQGQVLLGPALVFALALRRVWCLHCSAVLHREKSLLLLGESGEGKSTLASWLARQAGWPLVADDILPVGMDAGSAFVLPHYPQLKLPADAQPGPGLPERLPVGAVILLEAAGLGGVPAIHPLDPSRSVQACLAHVAGTRMLPADLLALHLEFSTRFSRLSPVFRLRYPHDPAKMNQVQALLGSLT